MFWRALTFRPPPSSPPSRREHVLDVGLTETSTSGGKKLWVVNDDDVNVNEDYGVNVDVDDDVNVDANEDEAGACARCLVDSDIKI